MLNTGSNWQMDWNSGMISPQTLVWEQGHALTTPLIICSISNHLSSLYKPGQPILFHLSPLLNPPTHPPIGPYTTHSIILSSYLLHYLSHYPLIHSPALLILHRHLHSITPLIPSSCSITVYPPLIRPPSVFIPSPHLFPYPTHPITLSPLSSSPDPFPYITHPIILIFTPFSHSITHLLRFIHRTKDALWINSETSSSSQSSDGTSPPSFIHLLTQSIHSHLYPTHPSLPPIILI